MYFNQYCQNFSVSNNRMLKSQQTTRVCIKQLLLLDGNKTIARLGRQENYFAISLQVLGAELSKCLSFGSRDV